MVTTHTVNMKPLHPLGGASRGGLKSYVGKYTTESVHAHSYLQLSPNLNVSFVEVCEATNLNDIPLATSGSTASTGTLLLGATTASTGVVVFAIGK